MEHESAKSRFTCYYDGLLSEENRKELDEHLAGCDECRSEWETFKKTVEGIAGLGIETPPEDFAENVASQIRRRRIRTFWTRQNLIIFKTAILSFILIGFVVLLYLTYTFLFAPTPTPIGQPGAGAHDRNGVRIIGPMKTDISSPEQANKEK